MIANSLRARYLLWRHWTLHLQPMAENHPLRPARGVLMGILLAVPLWGLFALIWAALP